MRYFCFLIFLIVAFSEMYAISPSARLRLKREAGGSSSVVSSRADSVADPYRPIILQISDASVVDTLEAMGVIIFKSRGDLLLTSVPRDSVMRVISLGGIFDAQSLTEMSLDMDIARPFGHVDAVQQGAAPLISNYDGRGVVVGFSDIGFDAHHIAFKDRVAAIYNYDTPNGTMRSAVTEAEVAASVTDNATKTHATHVGNILAGGYKGNGYYGVASGAEIVATTSRLYDVGILSGVEDIIAYAKKYNRPAVINLSLSSNTGAHDGTDLVCQYLSRCAEDAIICLSAGNSGDTKCYSSQDLALGDASFYVNTRKSYNGFNVEGYTDVWSASDVPFEICVQVYNSDTGEVVYSTPWFTAESSIVVNSESDPEWSQYMSGSVWVETGWAPTNGRFVASIMYDTQTEDVSTRGPWSLYYNFFTVRRCEEAATEVDIFGDASSSYLSKPRFAPNQVNSDCSISNLCTAQGVISVGMAISRVTAPQLGGEPFEWSGEVGNMTKYSSYNITPRVERLPNLSAPGYYVISAISNDYLALNPDTEVSAMANIDGKDYYWYPECGTSMASPYLAGVIALWLQADPTLTSADVLDIACSTAQTDYTDITDPRWGAGCIDAMAGIREVIARASLSDVELPYQISVTPDRRLSLTGIDASEVGLYSVSGIAVDQASTLEPGIYILNVRHNKTCKLIVR